MVGPQLTSSDIAAALRIALPLRSDAEVQRLADLIAAKLTSASARAESSFSADPTTESLLRDLAGQDVQIDRSAIHFGANNTFGTVQIDGDVAGRDLVKIAFNFEDDSYDVVGRASPYRGLDSYSYEDRLAFVGREDQIDQACNRLTMPGSEEGLLFITGASGCGKSSFVPAGLIPALETHYRGRGLSPVWTAFRPRTNPLAGLADALGRFGLPASPEAFTPESFRAHLQRYTPSNQVNILFIDQLEELFSHRSEPHQRELLALLGALGSRGVFQETHTHVLAAVRLDYLHDVETFPVVGELLENEHPPIHLRPLTADELRAAIRRPLEIQNRALGEEKRWQPELLQRLVEDVRDPTELPLLQVTLDAIWSTGRLTLDRYRSLTDTLQDYANTTVDHNAGSPRSEEARREIMAIFLDLVTVSSDADRRRDARYSQPKATLIGDRMGRERLIDDLVNTRLLSIRRASTHGAVEVDVVDIIHETLLRSWSRLSGAVKDNLPQLQQRERFRNALRVYEGKQHDGVTRKQLATFLLAGPWLAEARDLNQRDDVVVREPGARAFFRASVQREQESRSKRAWILGASGLLVGLVLLAATLFSLFQTNTARSAELAAKAIRELDLNPEASVSYAMNAARLAPTTEAEAALRAVLAAPGRAVLRRHTSVVSALAFSGQRGDRLVVADGGARMWNLESRENTELLGPARLVTTVAVSPDERWIAAASDENVTHLWPASDPSEIRTIRGNRVAADGAFSPDSAWLLTSGDTAARLYAIGTRESTESPVAELGHDGSLVVGAAFSRSGKQILTVGADGTARVWDRETLRSSAVLCHGGAVTDAAFSPNEEWVVTAGANTQAWVWSARPRDAADASETCATPPLATMEGHIAPLTDVAFSENSRRLVTASRDGTARVWEATTGQRVATLVGHSGPVNTALFSADGVRVLTGGNDGVARVWDVSSGRTLVELRGHDGPIRAARFSPNGDLVATASDDGSVRLWEPRVPGAHRELRGDEQSRWVTRATFNLDGSLILTAGLDNAARLWVVGTDEPPKVLVGHSGLINDAGFSPDGRRIMTASDDGSVRLWNDKGEPVGTMRANRGVVTGAMFSRDGTRVVAAHGDGTAVIWDVRACESVPEPLNCSNVAELPSQGGPLNRVVFSSDGRHIVTAGMDGIARVWDLPDQRIRRELPAHPRRVVEVTTVVSSPDGRFVMTGHADGTAHIWDLEADGPPRALSGHTGAVVSAVFASDGRSVLTGSADHTARIWNVSDGSVRAEFHGHTGAINRVAFSDHHQWVLTASDDGTARVWEAASGRSLMELRDHTREVTDAEFGPGGRLILTASRDGSARVFACEVCGSLADLRARVCGQLIWKHSQRAFCD